MRIIAGEYGGRKLEVPKDKNIRPTSDKIRGAIFNALEARSLLHDSIVLDAFCGSGALSLEALSRGAKHATFIDKDQTSLNLAKNNAQMLRCEKQCEFLKKDSTKLSPYPTKEAPYTVIFLDPPYNKNLIEPAINALIEGDWLDKNAFFVIECDRREEPNLSPLEINNEKIYGDTKIIFAYR